jgi:hypothetical protein
MLGAVSEALAISQQRFPSIPNWTWKTTRGCRAHVHGQDGSAATANGDANVVQLACAGELGQDSSHV